MLALDSSVQFSVASVLGHFGPQTDTSVLQFKDRSDCSSSVLAI